MKSPKLALAVAILLIGAILGVAFQNDLFSSFLFAAMAGVIFIPLAVVTGIIALIRKKMTYSLVIGISCLLSLFVFLQTGNLLNQWKVASVENYVARALPILDRMKSRNGSYPTVLPVDVLGQPPFLLREDGEYRSDGTKFYFVYIDEPAGWAGGPGALRFDSVKREWVPDEDSAIHVRD